jgi:hypothetical protein
MQQANPRAVSCDQEFSETLKMFQLESYEAKYSFLTMKLWSVVFVCLEARKDVKDLSERKNIGDQHLNAGKEYIGRPRPF